MPGGAQEHLFYSFNLEDHAPATRDADAAAEVLG
jgi:hypothetical protein